MSGCMELNGARQVLKVKQMIKCFVWLASRSTVPQEPLCRASIRWVFPLHSGGRRCSTEDPAARDPPQSFRRISLFSVTDFNRMRGFAHGTFWPWGVCYLSVTGVGQGGEAPKQMQRESWYKDGRMGLVLQEHAASSNIFPTDFRETLVHSVLTWKCLASHRVRTWSYLCMYLFSLPLSAHVLRIAVQKWEGKWEDVSRSPGARCIVACPRFYPLHLELLFQLFTWVERLETKGVKQEPSLLCPVAETGHWCGRTIPGINQGFLLAASTCLRTKLLLQLLGGTKGHTLTREDRLLLAVWGLRS